MLPTTLFPAIQTSSIQKRLNLYGVAQDEIVYKIRVWTGILFFLLHRVYNRIACERHQFHVNNSHVLLDQLERSCSVD